MIKIYHNPRCTKSRQGVAFLEENKVEFEIIKYLNEPFTESSLKEVLLQLEMTPMELVRKTEAIWKSDYKGKELTDAELVTAMVNNPKLIERPIVVHNNKAVVARPTEKISDIL
ncbi:arsenate reductase (glutaredoxin) [Flavobacteriaceae bacterium]|nr:arsenate reductase (glutaredoxin) [Flavobacteriaceae bacterium]